MGQALSIGAGKYDHPLPFALFWNSPPLGNVDGFHNPRNLIDEGDGSGDVVDDGDIADLFPRHWHILQQLEHSMWHVLQSTAYQGKWYHMIIM